MRQPDEHELQNGWPEELALDDGLGPALPLDARASEALLNAALFQAGFAPSALPKSSPQPRSARRLWWQAAAAVLLACVGLGSASAAVMWWSRREPDPPTESAPPPPAAPRAAAPARSEVPEQAPTQADPAPIPASSRPKVRAPEDWLDEANRLRAKGRWQAAEEAYGRVWQNAPRSSAAYVARIAAASVRLEHREDPRGALAHYRAALAQHPQGPLREEALFGVAEAHRKLGDRAREQAALERFLREHADSPLAARARTRLEALTPEASP